MVVENNYRGQRDNSIARRQRLVNYVEEATNIHCPCKRVTRSHPGTAGIDDQNGQGAIQDVGKEKGATLKIVRIQVNKLRVILGAKVGSGRVGCVHLACVKVRDEASSPLGKGSNHSVRKSYTTRFGKRALPIKGFRNRSA